ncbi:hypothetical protein NLX71_12490 [Paenibacillus sp. MZ04-78.2]|uniref:hypothetical protein n=1 Tax=Paenibacillus sp. MZ04-78.2 TaxID=2962034 RepID=UPI0020B8C9FF|nr:hypothetical protein [Paenibacillus sp. MZ04-78.2]MCP3774122.1 hypothetical protein [Paenibacillus sp. MZ04-78.2]
MTEEEAQRLLMLHSFSMDEAIDHPKGQTGFLMSLRPYRGLIEENFHEVMYALSILQKKLGPETPHLDRELVAAVWGMCHLSRAWGVHPEGLPEAQFLQMEERGSGLGDGDTIGLSFKTAFQQINFVERLD